MHEKCDFNEKERVKETYISLKTKPLRVLWKKMTKIALDWIGQRKTKRRVFEDI